VNKNNFGVLVTICFILFIILTLLESCSSSEKDNSKNTDEPHSYRSSYWYDSPEQQRRHSEQIVDKYYDRDENGQLHKKKEYDR
jgi:hypothetical protein